MEARQRRAALIHALEGHLAALRVVDGSDHDRGSEHLPAVLHDSTRLDPQARVAPEGREAARRLVHSHTLFV